MDVSKLRGDKNQKYTNRILDTGIQALPARWAVTMGSISNKEYTSDSKLVNHADVGSAITNTD